MPAARSVFAVQDAAANGGPLTSITSTAIRP